VAGVIGAAVGYVAGSVLGIVLYVQMIQRDYWEENSYQAQWTSAVVVVTSIAVGFAVGYLVAR
jgi:H+/Cl- antiporter ClcA